MKFVIGKKYKFSSLSESMLVEQVRGNIFIPIEINEYHTHLRIYDDNLIPGPYDKDYWTGDPESSDRWEYQIDFSYSDSPWGRSVLEFKFV